MQNNTVYVIKEDNHGLIGVADSARAAFSFLVKSWWIVADTPCGYSWDDDRTLEEVCKEEGVTKRNFLDWAVNKLENTDFWENAGFYIHREGLFTEETI